MHQDGDKMAIRQYQSAISLKLNGVKSAITRYNVAFNDDKVAKSTNSYNHKFKKFILNCPGLWVWLGCFEFSVNTS